MIVAITGATGFIGKKLVARHLALGDEVRVLSRRQASESEFSESARWFRGDLCDSSDIMEFVDGADVLYHCAAELRDASRMEAVTVGGTAKLIAAASGKVGRWVQLSSVGAYGPVRTGIVTEDSPEHPRGPYERTKTQADELVREAGAAGAFAYAMLRPSTVFGNDMPNQSLVQWVGAIQRGLFFYIGKRGAMVNYVHVDSVLDALLLCATSEGARNRLYIVSEEMEIERFVGLICQTLGRPAPGFRMPEGVARVASAVGGLLGGRFPLTQSRIDALTGRAVYSSSKLATELGYVPSVPLEAGLRSFVENWSAHNGR